MNIDKFDFSQGFSPDFYEKKYEHFLWFNRNKDKAENDTEQRAGALRRFVQRATEALGGTAEAVALAPLVAFKGLMRKILVKKGFYTNSSVNRLKLKELVTAFYDKIVKENENFDGEEGVIKEYMTIPAFRQGRRDLAVAGIIAIASAVLSFITAIMDKKKDGQPLTNIENDIANLGEAATNAIENMKEDEIDRTVGSYVRDAGTTISDNILPIALAVVALIFLLKK